MYNEIDYATRADLVAALKGYREQGVEVTVVGLGRTLRVPADDDLIGTTPELVAEQWDDERLLAFAETATEEEIQTAINNGWVTEDQVMEALDKLDERLDPEVQDYVDNSTVEQLQQALADGHIDKATLLRYETAGKARKGVLAVASEES